MNFRLFILNEVEASSSLQKNHLDGDGMRSSFIPTLSLILSFVCEESVDVNDTTLLLSFNLHFSFFLLIFLSEK